MSKECESEIEEIYEESITEIVYYSNKSPNDFQQAIVNIDIFDQYAHICTSNLTVRNRSLRTNIIIYEIVLYRDPIARISFFMVVEAQNSLDLFTTRTRFYFYSSRR